MSVTISLALAMQKMTRANSLVRQLVACETIGSATVICSDKTGTMTQNKMTACRVITKNSVLEKTDPNWTNLTSKNIESPKTPIEWLAFNAAVNSTAHLEEKEGKLVSVGNSTEGALLLWLKENKKDYAAIRANSTIKHKGLFSPERKTMSTTINHGSEEITLVKGAPEIIIASCKSMMQQDGTIQNLDAIDLGNIRQTMEQAASQAMRVLGFAIKQKTTDSDDALTLCGFICIQDPLRPEVRNAIADCKSAGIQVIMITGDNPITANAIGVEAGLAIEGKTKTYHPCTRKASRQIPDC
jgi:Ca2+-transporting ATPase